MSLSDTLIEAAVRGDPLAMDRLLHRHYAMLEKHVRVLVTSDLASLVSPEDLLQETFTRAIRNISQLEVTTSAGFAAWLKSIAENYLRNTIRHHHTLKRELAIIERAEGRRTTSSIVDLLNELSGRETSPSKNTAEREAIQAVQIGVAGLPDDQRQAIRLRYFDGCSVSATADAMQRSPAAIRGLLQRGKESLRVALGRSSRWFG